MTAAPPTVEQHLGLVHELARRMHRRLAVRVEMDELVSAGTLGLIAALEAFDGARGFTFSTFAAPRIRGAMLDSLREGDAAPRSVRRKARLVKAARASLERETGRAPRTSEVAAALGVCPGVLARWEVELAAAAPAELDQPCSRERCDVSPADTVADEQADAAADVERADEAAWVRRALARLTEQQRMVVAMMYDGGMRQREVGAALGLTESRISQVHATALRRLRQLLDPAGVRAAA